MAVRRTPIAIEPLHIMEICEEIGERLRAARTELVPPLRTFVH